MESKDQSKKYQVVEMRSKEDVDWSVQAVLNDPAFGSKGFLEILEDFLPVRLFRNARLDLTGKEKKLEDEVKGKGEYLEVKGMADDVVAVKSRGQIGIITVQTNTGPVECISILAKFSVKPPLQDIETDKEEFRFIIENDGVKRLKDGTYLLQHFMDTELWRDEIVTYKLYTLPSAGKIMKSAGTLDLVQKKADRKLNCCFDYKRDVLLQVTPLFKGGFSYPPPYTLPHFTLADMKTHRYQADNIRKSGRVARPKEVNDRVRLRGRRSRASKGEADRAVRMLLIAMLQEILPTTGTLDDYAGKVAILNEEWVQLPLKLRDKRESWTATDLKNFKRAVFESHCVPQNEDLIGLVTKLCGRFGVNANDAVSLLCEQPLNLALVIEVVKAVLNGQSKEPFTSLAQAGNLPGRQDLLFHLSPPLTEDILTACKSIPFRPGTRPASDRDELARLFRRIRIPAKSVAACASALIEPSKTVSRPGKYSVSPSNLENVVCCLLQPDYPARPAQNWIKTVLRPYGLSDPQFVRLKKERFIPHRVTNTPKNRAEILKICKALKVDAALVTSAVVDP